MGTVSGCSRHFGAVSGCSRQPLVSYHSQLSGPVHGATTHENSTTMSFIWVWFGIVCGRV
jgi:hypothetical protein